LRAPLYYSKKWQPWNKKNSQIAFGFCKVNAQRELLANIVTVKQQSIIPPFASFGLKENVQTNNAFLDILLEYKQLKTDLKLVASFSSKELVPRAQHVHFLM